MNRRDADNFERWLSENAAKEAGNCPDGVGLEAYARGELDPADDANVRAHLDFCGECTVRVAEERRAFQLMEEVSVLPESDLEAPPERLRESLLRETGRGARSRSSFLALFARRLTVPAWTPALAASLLLLLAYPAWLGIKRAIEGGTEIPAYTPERAQMFTLTGGTRSGAAATKARLRDGLIVCQLVTLANLTGFSRVDAEVVDSAGRSRWKIQALKPSGPDGGFVVVLDPSVLGTGEWRIQLSGARDGESETLQEYAVQILP